MEAFPTQSKFPACYTTRYLPDKLLVRDTVRHYCRVWSLRQMRRRMTLRYYARHERLFTEYVGQRKGIEDAEPLCQRIPGADIDRVVGDILPELVNPVNLEIALTLQQELQSRLDQSDRLRRQHVERARYEAELAQRRYMRVDPENRLVADSLEADWNQKLRALADAQQEYEQRREQDRRLFNDEQRSAILALAQAFLRLWKDPTTEDRDRKRMIRLLVEDVTMIRGDQIRLHFRFRGDATKTIALPDPPRIWETLTDGFRGREQNRSAAGHP